MNQVAQLELAEKEKELIKYLNSNIEEQIIINKGRYNWKLIRKRIRVINMIPFIGENEVRELYHKKNKEKIQVNPDDMQPSKFIINP